MYEYMFIRVSLKEMRKNLANCEDKINRLAQERWRLIQILTPGTASYGEVYHYEFIMERKIQ